MTVIKDNQDMLLDPIDRHYNALECGIEPIEKDEEEYEVCFNENVLFYTTAEEIFSHDKPSLHV